MKRDNQIGALAVIVVLAFVLIGATDGNVAAWFTFGLASALLLLLLRGHVDELDRSHDERSRRPHPRPRAFHRTTT